MTRTILISLCILLGGLYGCKTENSKVTPDDKDHIETKVDTTGKVISPPLVASRMVDTLLFQAADLSATIVGQRNPLGQRRGSMEVNIPVHPEATGSGTKDSLISFAYWIGAGEIPILAYNGTGEEVPPGWSQPGVSAPLAAYLQGYPVFLPHLSENEEPFQRNQVRFDFVDSQDKNAFGTGKAVTPLFSRDPKRPNFGIISGEQLQNLHRTIYLDPATGKNVFRFYFAYANQHQINSYTLQLKVVALYEVEQ